MIVFRNRGLLMPNLQPQANKKITDHFSWSELASKGNGSIWIPRPGDSREAFFWETIERAEKLRTDFGEPLVVLSGHRNRLHNIRVGGAFRSLHLLLALDLTVVSSRHPDPRDRERALGALWDLSYGLGFHGRGRYKTFIHLDCRELLGRAPAIWEDNSKWAP